MKEGPGRHRPGPSFAPGRDALAVYVRARDMMGIRTGGSDDPQGGFVRYIRLKEATLWAWVAGAVLLGMAVGVGIGVLFS
jgi:hypothetical protein